MTDVKSEIAAFKEALKKEGFFLAKDKLRDLYFRARELSEKNGRPFCPVEEARNYHSLLAKRRHYLESGTRV